ncbi:MAG: SIMPL domain-containing protein [Rhodoferax sp.]|nr:SIMPL domain-containing protein [Rhodoferax sp.]
MPEPARRVTLSASAQVQVTLDVLTLTLQVTRQGYEAATVQAQLKTALQEALVVLQKDAVPGRMDVRSGLFGLSPRYDRDGRITAWHGSAEWVLEGTDVARITQAAGRVSSMTVSRLGFGLTAPQRQQAQAKAQVQAIAQFRQRAAEIAQGFGAAGYVLDDLQIGYDDGSPQFSPQLLAARAISDTGAVPAQAGITTVTVGVSGSVRLR